MRLILGVIDIPYVHTPAEIKRAKKRLRRQRKAKKPETQNITTGDVATMLEAKYHPMEIFAELHKDDIAADLENGLKDTVEALMMGAPPTLSAFDGAVSQIETRFKQFLSNGEMEKLGYPGVPTQAALRGISHRFKHPYAKRAPRPSFIDTGLYQASFAAEVKDD